ncbi:MAG: diguanylate cyclase [Xanthomonadales bacterium]|nr:diguanylate cyclase [Xanthomonadales bacterium]
MVCGLVLLVPAAQALPLGDPPVVRHASELYADAQAFAIVQDHRGMVYIGHAEGLLSFDGERWALLPLANGDMVRSLALAPDGRVLIGGYGAFGYLGLDADGRDAYVDLSARASEFLQGRELADIWDVVSAPEGVYFRALRDVFLWEPASDRLRHWYHAGRFGMLRPDPEGTLLQFRGEGLRRFDGQQWQPLPATSELQDLVFAALPVPLAAAPVGSDRGGGYLTQGADGRWWRIIGDRLWPQAMPAGLPDSSLFEHGLGLTDGSLALAGGDGALYLVDAQLQHWRSLPIDSGFLSGIVAALGGGLLIAADGGFFHVDWPGEWTLIDARHGLRGNLMSMARWRGQTWLLTSAGLSRLHAEAGEQIRLEALSWAGSTGLNALQALDEERALLAEDHRLLLLQGDHVERISDELVYPREFLPSRHHPGRYYIATELGLRHVDVAGAQIQLSPPFPDEREIRVVGIAETGPDEVWFGSIRHGLWQVRYDGQGLIVSAQAFALPEHRPQPATAINDAALLSTLGPGRWMVGTERGDFLWQDGQWQPTRLGPLVGQGDDQLTRLQGSDGRLWAYGAGGIWHRPVEAEWRELRLRHLRRGQLLAHYIEGYGALTLVASHQLLLFRPRPDLAERSDSGVPGVRLTAVQQVFPNGAAQPLALQTAPASLQAGDYALSFQFALPEMSVPGGARYRARLEGYNEPWSEWSRTRAFAYSRLRPGDYVLQVQARDAAGRESAIEPYRFSIQPPWYARGWVAALAFVLALLLAAWLLRWFVRRRLHRLQAERERLAELVAERTRELATANRQLQQIAHLDGLTGIANRRRLDDHLEQIWRQACAAGTRVALLAIDVDHFKAYNDSQGHLAGDELLKALVPLLAAAVREADDLLARFGGEEFLVVLPGLDSAAASRLANDLRQQVEAAALGATVSIGVASHYAPDSTLQALLQAADQALYAAKDSGRNRVASAPDSPAIA